MRRLRPRHCRLIFSPGLHHDVVVVDRKFDIDCRKTPEERTLNECDQTVQRPTAMHHFGVLVPSTNTTLEIEYGRLLPPTLQVHVARIPLLSSGEETTPRGDDTDVDYQAHLVGSAKVEVVALAQTAASLSSDDFDDRITKRMSEAAGVPAITAARAIGLAVRALGARRVALATPFPIPVLERLERHYVGKYGLEVVARESFSSSDSVSYPALGQELARDAIARTN